MHAQNNVLGNRRTECYEDSSLIDLTLSSKMKEKLSKKLKYKMLNYSGKPKAGGSQALTQLGQVDMTPSQNQKKKKKAA